MHIHLKGFEPALHKVLSRLVENSFDLHGTGKNTIQFDQNEKRKKTIICTTELHESENPSEESEGILHEWQRYGTSLVAAKLASDHLVTSEKDITVLLCHENEKVEIDQFKALRAMLYEGKKDLFLKVVWDKPIREPVKTLPQTVSLNQVA